MLDRLDDVTRIVATPAAIDDLVDHLDAGIALRTAPDEVLVIGTPVSAGDVGDAHAIVIDDTGWCGTWLDAAAATRLLRRTCDWQPPASRPAFAQGLVAGLPTKLWFEDDRVLIVAAHVRALDLDERLQSALGSQSEARESGAPA